MRSEGGLRWMTYLADLARLVVLASIAAAALYYPTEAVIRFILLFLALLVPRSARIPGPYDLAFCVTLTVASWSSVAHWYETVEWSDDVVHAITPAATASMIYLLLAQRNLLPGPRDPATRRHWPTVPILILTLGLSVAALWEFYEWIAQELSTENINVGYDDTIFDLALGGLGSLVAGLATAVWAARGHSAERASAQPSDGGTRRSHPKPS